MISKDIRDLVLILNNEGLNTNEVLLFLLNIREDLNLETNLADEEHMFLFKNKIIVKNYVTNKLQLNIAFYGSDVSENKLLYNITNIKEEVVERVDEFRTLFLGIRSGSVGIKKDITDKLVQFMFYHPEITFDKIIQAAHHYIATTDPNYVMNAGNFIINDKNESKLLTVLEEIELSGEIKSNLL